MALLLRMHGRTNAITMSTAIPHILVIDDNEAILDSVAMVLRWNALRVSTKNKMDNFKSDIYNISPDCILMDKALGWADGCNLCSDLKMDTETQHIPVIMFSAMAQTKQTCLDAGANAFLEKPFDIDVLLRLVFSFTPGPVLPG